MKKLTLIGLLCLVASSHASAQLYKNVSSSGKVVYSDRPSDEQAGQVTLIRAAVARPARDAKSGQPGVGGQATGASGSLYAAGRGSGPKLVRIDVLLRVDGAAPAPVRGPAFAVLRQHAGLVTSSSH